jgi:hypothetical protein
MQPQAIVLVADAAIARAFSITKPEPPATALQIEEEEGLIRPEGRIKEGDRFSDSMPTGNRTRFGNAHSYSDHRDSSDLEHKSFARQIAGRIGAEVAARQPRQIIIAVSNSLQALLEQAVAKDPATSQRVQWLKGEFTGLTPAQLQKELVERRLLTAVA